MLQWRNRFARYCATCSRHSIGIHGHGTITYSIVTASAVHNLHGAGRHFHGTVVDMSIISMHIHGTVIQCHGTLASSRPGGMYGTIRYIHGAQLENNGAVLPHDNVLHLYKVSKGSSYILAVLCTLVQRCNTFTRHRRLIIVVP